MTSYPKPLTKCKTHLTYLLSVSVCNFLSCSVFLIHYTSAVLALVQCFEHVTLVPSSGSFLLFVLVTWNTLPLVFLWLFPSHCQLCSNFTSLELLTLSILLLFFPKTYHQLNLHSVFTIFPTPVSSMRASSLSPLYRTVPGK